MRKKIEIEEVGFCDVSNELQYLSSDDDFLLDIFFKKYDLVRMVDKWLKELKPKEEMVIRLFFGLDDEEEHDFIQIAKKVGCSKGWARNLFYNSKRKLARKSRRIKRHLAIE